MFLRFIQLNIYPDMSMVQVTSDIIGFYFKLYLIFLIIYGYLNSTKTFNVLNKALLINLLIYCSFIFIEFFSGFNYHDIYNTVLGKDEIISKFSQRAGLSIIHGPNNHWVSTGTFLASCFSIILYNYKLRYNFISILLLGLFLLSIFIIGARSAIISAFITMAFYFIFDSSRNRWLLNICIISLFTILFVLSPYGQFIYNSLSDPLGEGLNLYRRLIVQYQLFYQIKDVPLLGYGFVARHGTELFQFQEWPEISFIFTEIYDYGLIMGILSSLFIISMVFRTISFRYTWSNISTYSSIAIILCFISNGNQEYNYFLIPIIFYTYSIWYKNNLNRVQIF